MLIEASSCAMNAWKSAASSRDFASCASAGLNDLKTVARFMGTQEALMPVFRRGSQRRGRIRPVQRRLDFCEYNDTRGSLKQAQYLRLYLLAHQSMSLIHDHHRSVIEVTNALSLVLAF